MSYLIINDIHGGLQRSTTLNTATLKAFATEQDTALAAAVERANVEGRTLIVLGDLFHTSQVDYTVMLRAWLILGQASSTVLLVKGNHDQGGNQEKLTAFDFLCTMLPDNVVEVTKPLQLEPDCWIVPHLPNQTMFDAALAELPAGATVLTHANYDNPFAVYADHSLNLSPGQADKFDHVIMGHEHERRSLPGIDILGAPYPCNIGECATPKGFHLWDGPEHEPEFVETYNPAGNYLEINWKDLESAPADVKFIRVTGTAEFQESAGVIQSVDAFRKKHSAFFISNTVTVNGIELQAVQDAGESLDNFNALEMFWQVLKTETKERIREIINA